MKLSDILLTDLPKTKSLVHATVLAMGLATVASCSGDDVSGPAPTCGPCCHGGGPECDDTGAPPPIDSGAMDSMADAATDAAADAADAADDATTDAPADAATDAAADAP